MNLPIYQIITISGELIKPTLKQSNLLPLNLFYHRMFSHNFKYVQKKVGSCEGSSVRMKSKGHANSWPCLLYSGTVVIPPRGYAQKRIARALMGIIKKLPISGNRLAFCRLPGEEEIRVFTKSPEIIGLFFSFSRASTVAYIVNLLHRLVIFITFLWCRGLLAL